MGPAERAEAEAKVPLEWKPGDVLLGLCEVWPVAVGWGKYRREVRFVEKGMGRVYRVRHRQWQMDMAVKQGNRVLTQLPTRICSR